MLSGKNNRTSKWLVTGCAAMALCSTGCRGVMPGAKLFGFRSEPSAEALAGSGPTVNYPPPPGDSVTPEAIASVAGGTAVPVSPGQPAANTSQVAGFDVSPGFASQASPNFAAAQANGFNGTTRPASFAAPESNRSPGYSFGSPAFTPKSDVASVPPGNFKRDATAGAAPPDFSTGNSYAVVGSPAAPVPPAGASVNDQSGGGFTMPTDVSPAVAAIANTPTAPGIAPGSPSNTGGAPNMGFDPPPAAAPSFSTASLSDTITAPSTTLRQPPPVPTSEPTGYSPGSTAGAGGYPLGGSDTPTTTGSFYR